MDSSEIDCMQSRLEQGALKVQRERFPWTPLQIWRTRDTPGRFFPDSEEEIELKLIRDSSSGVVIFHSSLVASRAEVDYLCRSAALYASQKSSPSGVRAVLCALEVSTTSHSRQ